jgi:hypothetical protein
VTDTERTDGGSYGEPSTPDANQEKNEPIGTSPETSAKSGGSAESDNAAGAQQMTRSASPPVDGGVPSPGDSQGVSVPSVQAAAGTSEQSEKVDGVTITSLAAPGKPDGEVDTRPSSTPL